MATQPPNKPKVPKGFRRFTVSGAVSAMLGHGVALQWDLDPGWACRNVAVDILQGFSATDEFTKLDTVTDTDIYIDAVKRNLDNQPTNLWYALKVTDLDHKIHSFSAAQPVGTAMRSREWLIAKEVVRREYVRLVKRRAGTRGWLLRRRITGKPCTYSTSPETGQTIITNCPYCYGTGFIGGYYPAQEAWMEMDPDSTFRRLDPSQGLLTQTQKTFRCLAYPHPNPNDYWISGKTGIAYRFDARVSNVASLEEEPLILAGDWYPEEAANIIYTFPVPTKPT